MTNFLSCHLTVDRRPDDDGRHVHDFIEADFSWGGTHLFLKRTPSTNANIFSRCYANFRKTSNTSTGSDSTFTVFPLLMVGHSIRLPLTIYICDTYL